MSFHPLDQLHPWPICIVILIWAFTIGDAKFMPEKSGVDGWKVLILTSLTNTGPQIFDLSVTAIYGFVI